MTTLDPATMSVRASRTAHKVCVFAGVLAAAAMAMGVATAAPTGSLRVSEDPAPGRQQVTLEIASDSRGEAEGLSARLGSAIEYRDRGIDYPTLLREASVQILPASRGARAVQISWLRPAATAEIRLLVVLRTEGAVDVRSYPVVVGPATGHPGDQAVDGSGVLTPAQASLAHEPVDRPAPAARTQAFVAQEPEARRPPARADGQVARPKIRSNAEVQHVRTQAAFTEMDSQLRKIEAIIANLHALVRVQDLRVANIREQAGQLTHARLSAAQGVAVRGGGLAPARLPHAIVSGARDVDWRLQSVVGVGLSIVVALVLYAFLRRRPARSRRY